jgi:hypothetical protein
MHNDSFPFAHLVIHLVFILMAASQRARRGAKTVARQSQDQKPVGTMPPGFRLRTNRDRGVPKPKGNTMKPIIRYRSQFLFRKSYKPNRVIRIRPAQLNAESKMRNAECDRPEAGVRYPSFHSFCALYSQLFT